MRKPLVIILIFSLLFIPGCWDMREINELGLVMAVGVDKSPNNPNNFLVTVQIANPQPSSGGEAGKPPNKVWIASAEGKTLFEAIRTLATFSSQRIMWAHNNVIIIGESLARDDITPVIDFFTHNYELRMKTWIAVAQGSASDFLTTGVGSGDIPGQSIADMFRYQAHTGLDQHSSLLKVFRDFTSQDVQPVLSLLSFNQAFTQVGKGQSSQNSQEQIQISGSAVFKGSKMIGQLSAEDSKGLAWVLGSNPNPVLSVPHPGNQDKFAAVEIKHVNVDIKSYLDESSMPYITIKVSGMGSISEEDTFSNLSISELKASLEKAVAEEIVREINLSLTRVQKEYKSDVLGLGKTVHAQHKKEWNEIIRERWEDLYPDVLVTVEANIKIHNSALNQTPLRNYKLKGNKNDQS